MNIQLKQRLLLAIVILALIVIFVPMLFRKHTNSNLSSLTVFPQAPSKPDVESMTPTPVQQPLVANQPSSLTPSEAQQSPVTTQDSQDLPQAQNDVTPTSAQVSNEIQQPAPTVNAAQVTSPISSTNQLQAKPIYQNGANTQSNKMQPIQEPTTQTKSINSAQQSVLSVSQHQRMHSSAHKVLSVKPSNIPVSASIQDFALSQSELNNIADHVKVRNDNVNSNNVLPEITSTQKKQLKTAKSLNEAWVVQLGSFANKNNAIQLVKKLRAKGFTSFAYPMRHNHLINYHVYVGPMIEKSQAQTLRDKLKKEMKINSFVAKFDPTSIQ